MKVQIRHVHARPSQATLLRLAEIVDVRNLQLTPGDKRKVVRSDALKIESVLSFSVTHRCKLRKAYAFRPQLRRLGSNPPVFPASTNKNYKCAMAIGGIVARKWTIGALPSKTASLRHMPR